MAGKDELDRIIREMHSIVAVLDERTENILRQTEKTNGRVNQLEKEQSSLVAKVSVGATLLATVFATFVNRVL